MRQDPVLALSVIVMSLIAMSVIWGELIFRIFGVSSRKTFQAAILLALAAMMLFFISETCKADPIPCDCDGNGIALVAVSVKAVV